jgi:hypothetical protein
MATNYPGSLDTGTEQPSPLSTTEMDDAGFEHDVVHTNHSGAIIALETKVGTGSSTAVADSVLAGTGSGTSGWSTAPSLAGLTVDTDTLHVDATNNRVGIGTTSPGKTLDIQRAGVVEVRLVSTDGNDTAVLFGDNTDTIRASVKYDTSEDRLEFRGYNNTTRMVISSNGRVGVRTTAPNDLLDVGDGTNPGSFRVHASGGGESFRVTGTVVRSTNIANLTTGAAANVYINTANNSIYRSTSSMKYKTDVETMEDSYADAILGLRPVWYRSLGPDDPDSWGYWGFIAEEVAQVDPRLVSFGVPTDYERQYDEDGEPIEPAVADLTEPENVQYDRMVPHLVNLLKRHEARIAALEAA